MTDPIPLGEDDLQAYLDRQLPPRRVAAVEAYLAAHPEIADRLERDRQLQAQLAAALQAKRDEPLPARLRIAAIAARRRRLLLAGAARAAAMILLFGAGGLAGWYGNAWSAAQSRGADGLGATRANSVAAFETFSVETRHPVEVRAEDSPHLVQWLSNRLRRKVTPPDLSALGFKLMGGRILPTGNVPAALLMYDDGAAARLTVYLQPMGIDGTDFRYAENDGVRTIYWAERRLAFAVSGRIAQAALLAAGRQIRGEMERAAESP